MFRSLCSKITAFTTLVIIVTMLLISYLVYQVSTTLILQNSITNLKSQARLIASDVENGIINITKDINVLSYTPPIQGIVRSYKNNGVDLQTGSTLGQWRERLAIIFTAVLKVKPSYTQIRYIGIADNGLEIVRVNQGGANIYETHEDALQEKATKNYFKESVKLSPESIYFSDINYNMENNRITYPLEPTIRVIKPIYSEQQELFGLLVINVNITRYLNSIFTNAKFTKDLVLYNTYGDILIYNWKNKNVFLYPGEENSNSLITYNDKKYSKSSFLNNLQYNRNLVDVKIPIYSNIHHDDSPLTLIISATKNSLFTKDYFSFNYFIFWLIFISLAASITVYYFSKYATRHLTRMVTTIQQSTNKPDSKLKLPTGLNDEVGLLAKALSEKTNQLNKIARYDSLTGLPNRKNIIEHLEEAIVRTKRNHSLLALAFIDLNNFKVVNDTYGHQVGDELLLQFGKNLQSTVRETDVIGRLGGDEFAIIAENFKDKESAISTFNAYSHKLSHSYVIKGVTINLIVSIGVSIYPIHSTNMADLLSCADTAMYQSKSEKKGNVHLCKPKH